MLQEEVTSSERQSGTTTILIVEDDDSIGEVLAVALSEEPSYTLVLARTAEEVFPILMSTSVHLLLMDYHLTDLDGLALYDLLHAQQAFEHLPVILMSASLERHLPELAQRHLMGLSKPFDLEDVLAVVREAIG